MVNCTTDPQNQRHTTDVRAARESTPAAHRHCKRKAMDSARVTAALTQILKQSPVGEEEDKTNSSRTKSSSTSTEAMTPQTKHARLIHLRSVGKNYGIHSKFTNKSRNLDRKFCIQFKHIRQRLFCSGLRHLKFTHPSWKTICRPDNGVPSMAKHLDLDPLL